jgi:hypothetical protein
MDRKHDFSANKWYCINIHKAERLFMKRLLLGVCVIVMFLSACAVFQKKTNQETIGQEAVTGETAAPETAVPVFERKIAEDVPSFVSDALKSVPQDALVGIGAAKLSNISMSQTMAAARAQADIARQINQVFVQMVRNYSVTSASDPEMVQLFQERISVTIVKARLSGVSFPVQYTDDDGCFWVAAVMNREPVSDTISNAQDQAKDDFPQMSSFSTAALLSDAIASIAKEEIPVAR